VSANSRGFSQAIGEIAKNWLRFAESPTIDCGLFHFPKEIEHRLMSPHSSATLVPVQLTQFGGYNLPHRKKWQIITGYASTLVRIQAALEQAGIEFIDNDDIGGFGLRFSRKKKR
jgi:hypothetical protein